MLTAVFPGSGPWAGWSLPPSRHLSTRSFQRPLHGPPSLRSVRPEGHPEHRPGNLGSEVQQTAGTPTPAAFGPRPRLERGPPPRIEPETATLCVPGITSKVGCAAITPARPSNSFSFQRTVVVGKVVTRLPEGPRSVHLAERIEGRNRTDLGGEPPASPELPPRPQLARVDPGSLRLPYEKNTTPLTHHVSSRLFLSGENAGQRPCSRPAPPAAPPARPGRSATTPLRAEGRAH